MIPPLHHLCVHHVFVFFRRAALLELDRLSVLSKKFTVNAITWWCMVYEKEDVRVPPRKCVFTFAARSKIK